MDEPSLMHEAMARLAHSGASDGQIAAALHLTAEQLDEKWTQLAISQEAVSREEGVNLVIAKLIVEAREALATKQDELALIIGARQDSAIVTFNLMGIITGISRHCEKLLGYPAAYLMGKSIDRVLNGGAKQVEHSAQEMARAEEGDIVLSNRFHERKDGTLFEASHSIVAIYGSNGHVTGFVREIRDLTSLRVHEIAIEEGKARLALLVHE